MNREQFSIQALKNAPQSMLKEVSDSELLNDLNKGTNDIDNSIGDDQTIFEREMNETNETNNHFNEPLNTTNPNFNYNGSSFDSGNSQSLNLTNILTPSLVVKLIDLMLPLLFVWIISFFGRKVKKSKLQASQKEQEILIPLVAAVMQQYNIRTQNPTTALLIGILGVYGMKTVEVFMEEPEPLPTIIKQTPGTNEPLKKSNRGGDRRSKAFKEGNQNQI